MTLAKDIVRDLLPAYWSGEATAATRDAVDAFFAQDPDFAKAARLSAQGLDLVARLPAGEPNAAGEIVALRRTKSVLRLQRILFALALTFTLNAVSLGFSFEISDGHVTAHWLAVPGQGYVVGAVLLIGAALWVFYGRVSWRVRTHVLG